MNLTIAIPTYKRSHLLALLIQDIAKQSLRPDRMIIVDGDPQSGEVKAMLQEQQFVFPVTYVPSNHGNLSYQRFLGWCVAADQKADVLIYFDDDQRMYQYDTLNWLVDPLQSENSVVGVGCYSRVPETGHDPAMDHLMGKKEIHWLVRLFGSHATLNLNPGDLTPIGHRIGINDDGQDYIETKWLQGRIMAYRMSAISPKTFSDDLLALDHIRCGLGEDTFLSRRIGARGKLLYTFRAIVDHPNADTPKSYPYEAYKYAYAASYSRRFLNDYNRVYEPPKLMDRWSLVKSYVGNTLLSWWRVITKPSKLNLSLAQGTTLGAFHGLTRPPTAKRLTPYIDWWADAEIAVKQAVEITQSQPQGSV